MKMADIVLSFNFQVSIQLEYQLRCDGITSFRYSSDLVVVIFLVLRVNFLCLTKLSLSADGILLITTTGKLSVSSMYYIVNCSISVMYHLLLYGRISVLCAHLCSEF
jgi:hypothetical protein